MNAFDRIQNLLEEQSKTQKELTDYLSINKSVYSTWKSGKSKSYSKYMIEIAKFFNTTLDYLYGIVDNSISCDKHK